MAGKAGFTGSGHREKSVNPRFTKLWSWKNAGKSQIHQNPAIHKLEQKIQPFIFISSKKQNFLTLLVLEVTSKILYS